MAERKTNGRGDGGAGARNQGRLLPGTASAGSAAKSKGRAATAAGLCVLLFGIVAWTFLPALQNGFVDYDDGLYVTANTHVQAGLSWHSLGWAVHSPVASNWHPLTLLSHMLDCQLYGLKPWGHHLTSVLLHALNTVLLFLLFRRMTGACGRAAVLAALFGLHPLRVESVAWVAERKDVLSTLFFLLTLWAYARYVESLESKVSSLKSAEVRSPKSNVQSPPQSRVQSPKSKVEDPDPGETPHAIRNTAHVSRFAFHAWYWTAVALFACGLMCKPMLVTLPGVLLLLDFWPLGRFGLSTINYQLSTPPAAQGSEFDVQRSKFASLLLEKVPFLILAAISAAITFQVQKQGGSLVTSLPLSIRLENVLVSYARYMGKLVWPANLCVFYPYPRQWPTWLVLASAAVLLVMLVAGVKLARRRPYLAVGWFWFWVTLVPVIGLVQVGQQSMADRYSYLPCIGLLLSLVWGAHELCSGRRYRTAALAVMSLAALILCAGVTRRQLGYWKDSESLFTRALAVTEDNDLAHLNLGNALFWRGAVAEAIPHYEEAVRIHPGKADAHLALAEARFQQHQFADAIVEYEEGLQLNPDNAEAHTNLGQALQATGQLDGAIAHYREAARLQPRAPRAQYELGTALVQRADFTNAARALELSLKLEPKSAPAHYALAGICRAQHRVAEALSHWREAARLAPGWLDPLNNLAWVLATNPRPEWRNGSEAVTLASRAVELSGTNNPTFLDTLAAAYAEAGQFAEATATAQAAHAAALRQGRQDLAGPIQQRLALYGSGHPYREAASAR